MGVCCSNRKGEELGTTKTHVYRKAQLQRGNETITRQHEHLLKINLHLSTYQQKSIDISKTQQKLEKTAAERVSRTAELGNSVGILLQLVIALSTESEAQFLAERQTADMGKDELLMAIKTARAQSRAEDLVHHSQRLRKYLEFELHSAEIEKKAELSLADIRSMQITLKEYGRYVGTVRKEVKDLEEELVDAMEATGDEKLDNQVRKWKSMRDSTLFLADDIDKFSHLLISTFEKQEAEFESTKAGVTRFLSTDYNGRQATEALAGADPYLELLDNGGVPLPRKSYRSTTHTPKSKGESPRSSSYVSTDAFTGGLRFVCLVNHYRDGEVLSPNDTFERFFEILDAKVVSHASFEGTIYAPQTLEMFFLAQCAETSTDLKYITERITKFAGGLDRLSGSPFADLAMEMLRLSESEQLTLHEESFLTKALVALRDTIVTENWPVTTKEKWNSGGWLKLNSAISLVEKWFASEPDAGGNVIAALMPEVSAVDMTVQYILHKLVENREDADDLFYELDIRKANNLQPEEFVLGVKSHLGVMLPESHLEEVAKVLDRTQSNGIFRSEFNNMFKTYQYTAGSGRFKVTMMDVVRALRSAYKSWQAEVSSELYLGFLNGGTRQPLAKIEAYVRLLDPEMSTSQVQQFMQKVEMRAGEVVDVDAFISTVLIYPIGRWSKSFYGEIHTAVEGLAWLAAKTDLPETVVGLLSGKKTFTDNSSSRVSTAI